jgi:hypothetical protein
MKTTITFLRTALAVCLLITFAVAIKANSESNTLAGLHCPSSVWVDCNDELWDLSIYGNAYYVDYSGQHDAGNPSVEYNLNSCNAGTIVRTWSRYIYGHLYTCSQTIYVSGGAFSEDNIHWPPYEYAVQGCDPPTEPDDLPPPYNKPTYDYLTCSLVAKTHRDQVFNFSPTCKKILRTWTVIDWCQYDPNNYYGPGKWTYTQVIKIEKADPPTIVCPEDITVWANTCSSGVANIAELTVDGDACGGEYIISNDSPYATYSGSDISGVYPIGSHRVRYKIEYGCGNKEYCYVNIYVEDSKAAVPICYGNIAVALMPVFEGHDYDTPVDGMVEVWAKDLNKGSYHPCRPDEILSYSFSSDPTFQAITFTCNQIGENEVQIWVTDERGNQSYCTAFIDVQNNGANIPECHPLQELTEARVAGQLTDMWEQPTSEAMVKITGFSTDTSYVITIDTTLVVTQDSFQNQSGAWLFYELTDTVITETIDTILTNMSKEMYSSENGDYLFEELDVFNHYQIAPEKYSKAADGIQVEDIIKVFSHIIGRETFDHPFYYLAADVDQSGDINIDDLLLMIDVYQGKKSDFPVASNWIFISKNQEWNEGEDAFDIEWQYVLDIMSLDDDSMYNDFWSVQLGNLIPSVVDDGGGRTTRRMKSESTQTIAGYTQDKDYQLFFAQFDGIESIPTKLKSNAAFLIAEKVDFPIVIWEPDIESNILISNEILNTEQSNTKLSVFRSDEIVNIKLDNEVLSIMDSYPNPFLNQVEISIHSEKSQQVFLEVRNVIGELIWKENKGLQKGMNQWAVDLSQTQGKGLLFYTIHADNKAFNGKWIRLK